MNRQYNRKDMMMHECHLIIGAPYNDMMRFIEDNTNCYLEELENTSVQDLKIFTNRNLHWPCLEIKDYTFLKDSQISFKFFSNYRHITADLKIFMSKYINFYFELKVYNDKNSLIYTLVYDHNRNIVEYENDISSIDDDKNSNHPLVENSTHNFTSTIDKLSNLDDKDYKYIIDAVNQTRSTKVERLNMIDYINSHLNSADIKIIRDIYNILITENEKEQG